jgi:hypothetical protein
VLKEKTDGEKVMLVQHETMILDSGATNHMLNWKDWFRGLRPMKVQVRVGNDELVEATGKGTIEVSYMNGTQTYEDSLYVPRLSTNLLSASRLTRTGNTLTFHPDGSVDILDGNLEVIGRAHSSNGLYHINGTCGGNVTNQTAMVITSPQTNLHSNEMPKYNLWHHRMGHLGRGMLNNLSKYVEGLDSTEVNTTDELCNGCALGKSH